MPRERDLGRGPHQAALAALVLALASACAPELTIGVERRLVVRTAVPHTEGRWREAGTRTPLEGTPVPAPGWFGTSAADGALPQFTAVSEAPSSVWASVKRGDDWVLAGSVEVGGFTLGFVRALNDADGRLWETSFGPADAITHVVGIALTNDGSLAVAGTERVGGGATTGWVALLETDGRVRWRRSFATDFQGQATGFVPVVVAGDPGAPSPSRRQLWVAGTRTPNAGGKPASVLQLTLDGDLWDSEPLDADGAGRGIATFSVGLAICADADGAVRLAWTQGGGVTGAALTEVRLDVPFRLAGCLATATQVKLVGHVERGTAAIPAVVTVDRATRAQVDAWEHPSERDVEVLGGAFGLSGELALFGQRRTPVRRWLNVVTPP